MVIIITGSSHTGKTNLAQNMMKKYDYPYMSIDHIKMGLIRSGLSNLTPYDSVELQALIWPIIREIIKTVIENEQNLIVEGCYVPSDWSDDFDEIYLNKIKFYCLVMSENYIENNFDKIIGNSSVIEKRKFKTDMTKSDFIKANKYYLEVCKSKDYNIILIDKNYEEDIKNYE